MQQITTIARALGADVVDGDAALQIEGLCGISDNQPGHLSFLSKASQKAAAANSQIPAFITTEALSLANKTCIIHPDPDYAIVLAAQHFVPTRLTYADESAIHPTATVHPSAVISSKVTIGAHVVIGCGVSIGMNTSIAPGVVIMDRVKIGAECVLHANSIIREDSVLGDRVVLQPGVVIGGDGYGFIDREGRHLKIPQLGNVVLEDDVEIGANTTIDRGRFSDTRVGRGTKVDNLVMLGHNVQTGVDCLLVAQTGISGSTRLGDRVVLGGQVGVAGHLTITDDVTVLGKSAVGKDLLRSGIYAGIMVRPVRLWRRAMAKLYADSKRGDDSTS